MLTPGIIWNMLTEPAALGVLGAFLVAAWPLAALLTRRYGGPRHTAALFVLAVGAVLALTATTLGGSYEQWDPSRALRLVAALADPAQLGYELARLGQNPERVANIVLFLPVGYLGALVRGRVRYGLAFGLALTLLVEAWQAVNGRGGEVGDVLNNGVGAVLGAGAAALVLDARRRRARQ